MNVSLVLVRTFGNLGQENDAFDTNSRKDFISDNFGRKFVQHCSTLQLFSYNLFLFNFSVIPHYLDTNCIDKIFNLQISSQIDFLQSQKYYML